MSNINIIADEYSDSSYSPPVGSTGYLEMDEDPEGRGDAIRNRGEADSPAWKTCPRAVSGTDKHGRGFAITGNVLWMRESTNGWYWGASPLVFWERAKEGGPVMLWLPPSNDIPLKNEHVHQFRRFIVGGERPLVIDGMGLMFEKPLWPPHPEGVVYVSDMDDLSGASNVEGEEKLVGKIDGKINNQEEEFSFA